MTNAEGCLQTSCKQVYFNVGIEEIGPQIRVYPNPAEQTLFIESSSSQMQHLSLQDLNGRILFESDCFSTKCELDVSALSKGMYILNVQTGNGVWIGKVWVKSELWIVKSEELKIVWMQIQSMA